MRITIVIGAFLPMPPAPTGAIEKVWHALAETFAQRGHDVVVVCPANAGESHDETIRNVRYRRLPRWKRSGFTSIDLLKDFLYSLRVLRELPPADVTVTNCFWLPALLRLARSTRTRIGALNVHAQRFPKSQYRLYRGADRISTVSEAIASAIRGQAPPLASIIKIIPNPVDVNVFRPDGPSQRDASRRTILFTGRIHPEKGLEMLASAARLVHAKDARVRLVLVGPSEVERGGGGVRFVARLKELGGSMPLELRPNIADPKELAATLRSCDIYCYPSIAFYGEASPVAPLEAMACGALVIVSDLPQFAGYVRDGSTGLVFPREAPDRVERLAATITNALADDARASALRSAGVAQARELSVDRVADAYLADFEELVAAKRLNC